MKPSRVFVHLALALVVWVGVLVVLSPPRRVCDPTGEAAAIGTLRGLATAQRDYVGRAGRFGTIRDLVYAGLVDEALLCSRERNGYRFDIEVRVDGQHFSASAEPVPTKDIWGLAVVKRHFVVDTSGMVRYSYSGAAGHGDTPVGE